MTDNRGTGNTGRGEQDEMERNDRFSIYYLPYIILSITVQYFRCLSLSYYLQ
jgi:hypothetical protein